MKKKLTPTGKFSPSIDWSKNQLSKNEMKQVLGGTDPQPPCTDKHGSVTDDPFAKKSCGS